MAQASVRSAVLRIQSAIVIGEFHDLLDPLHPNFLDLHRSIAQEKLSRR